jgi:tetratricopeptide (TPR) repeat protein
MSFLKEFLPAPIVDFAPIVLGFLLVMFLLPRLVNKLKDSGVWDRIVDTIGGEKYRLMQFEREVKRYIKRGDVMGAAQLYEEAEWYPEAINLYLEAEEYVAAGDLYERLEQWDQAADMYLQSGDWKRGANVYARAGNQAAAGEIYEQNGQKTDAAKLYFEAGRYDRAAALYQETSHYPQAGQSYEKMGEFILAAENYEKHWASTTSFAGGGLIASPSERESKFARKAGQLYEEAGALDKAVKIYERAGLTLQAAELAGRMGNYVEAGELLLKEEKLVEAAEMFDKAGDERKAALLRGEVAFQQGDDTTAAQEFLKGGDNLRAAELFETAGDLRSAAKCYDQADSPIQAANVYLRAGEKKDAATMFERGHDFDMAAKLFAETGEDVKASELFEKAGRLYEAGKTAHDRGDTDRAIQLLQKIDPDSDHFESATLILSRLFLDKGMASLAVEKLNRLLNNQSVNPKTLGHYYYLGRAYEQQGKTKEATEIYKKVMAERYGYEDVEQRLTRLTAHKPPQPEASVRQPPPEPEADVSLGSVQLQAPAATITHSPIQVAQALGKGLLGPTYKGIDIRNGKPVAVKFLRPELLRDREAVKAFKAEARLARDLEHPHLIRLLGLAEIGGRKAVTMEYVEGFDLAKLLAKNKRLTIRQALNLLTALAPALGFAHEKKILHRDLKMSNVLVAKGGILRLSGIGLGTLRTHELGRADGYPPPEFMAGHKPDEKTDIYALGAMLFHGLSGLHPESPEAARAGAPPSLRSLAPDVPEAFDQLIACCLAEQPSSRFESMAELNAAAQAI